MHSVSDHRQLRRRLLESFSFLRLRRVSQAVKRINWLVLERCLHVGLPAVDTLRAYRTNILSMVSLDRSIIAISELVICRHVQSSRSVIVASRAHLYTHVWLHFKSRRVLHAELVIVVVSRHDGAHFRSNLVPSII